MKKFFEERKYLDWVLLGAGLITFIILVFVNISTASIWFDEAFSAYITRFSYWEIAQFTAQDVHPPLYYWLLKAWTDLFGSSEAAFRSLSAFFGVLAVAGGYLLTRKFFGRVPAAVSLLFLTLSPTLIRLSEEARMYTMITVIVMAATWVLVKAIETKNKKLWALYGILLAVGMWTHYFVAVAWIAHWVWRFFTTPRKRKSFFTKEWVWSHALAVGLFLPWIPFFLIQTAHVQAGFWIGPVAASTPVSFITNFFYYLPSGDTFSWWALAAVTIIILTIVLAPKVYKKLSIKAKRNYLLFAVLAFVPPSALFILSMPPASPLFVERYLVPSMAFLAMFLAVTIYLGLEKQKTIWRIAPVILMTVMFIFGIQNVYWYGNYNKNSQTHIQVKEVVEMIHEKAPAGTPIVANSPWVYYEAVFYSTPDYPVYFIDEATDYYFGSLAMLKERDLGKIKDLEAFKAQHPTVWYIGGIHNGSEENYRGHVKPYQQTWVLEETVSAYSYINGKNAYGATKYRFGER